MEGCDKSFIGDIYSRLERKFGPKMREGEVVGENEEGWRGWRSDVRLRRLEKILGEST
jgi:hypothetical protein